MTGTAKGFTSYISNYTRANRDRQRGMQVMEKAMDLRKMKYCAQNKRGANLTHQVPGSLISVPAAAGAQGEQGAWDWPMARFNHLSDLVKSK